MSAIHDFRPGDIVEVRRYLQVGLGHDHDGQVPEHEHKGTITAAGDFGIRLDSHPDYICVDPQFADGGDGHGDGSWWLVTEVERVS